MNDTKGPSNSIYSGLAQEHADFIQRQRIPPSFLSDSGPSTFFNYDPRFVDVNSHQIRSALKKLDSDAVISLAYDYRMTSLLGGSIIIEDAGWKEDSDGKGPQNASASDGGSSGLVAMAANGTKIRDDGFVSSACDWIKRMYRYGWACGFAAFTFAPTPDQGMVLRVLDLEQLTVRHYQNALGENYFAYFQPFGENATLQQAAGLHGLEWMGLSSSVGESRPIPNVYTWVWYPPDKRGSIISWVTQLMSIESELNSKVSLDLAAHARMAVPPMITESQSKPYDAQIVTRTGYQERYQRSARPPPPVFNKDTGKPEPGKSDLERYASDVLDHHIRMRLSLNSADYETVGGQFSRFTGKESIIGHRIDLEPDKKYVTPARSEAPKDLHELRLYVQQLKLMRFGIPPAMLQAESSRGRISLDYNALTVHDHSNRGLQQEMLRILRFAYRKLRQPGRILEFLVQAPDNVSLTPVEVMERLEFTITLPGIPPVDTFRQLYVEGFLKYKPYVQFLSSNYSIAVQHFHETPQIPIDQLAGVALPAKAGDDSKAKSKKNPTKNREKEQKAKKKTTQAGKRKPKSSGGTTKSKRQKTSA